MEHDLACKYAGANLVSIVLSRYWFMIAPFHMAACPIALQTMFHRLHLRKRTESYWRWWTASRWKVILRSHILRILQILQYLLRFSLLKIRG